MRDRGRDRGSPLAQMAQLAQKTPWRFPPGVDQQTMAPLGSRLYLYIIIYVYIYIYKQSIYIYISIDKFDQLHIEIVCFFQYMIFILANYIL